MPACDAAGARFYGHPNHYVARWMERDGDRVSLGRLDRGDVARWDLDVVDVPGPTVLAPSATSPPESPLPGNPDAPIRQQIYLRALATIPNLHV